MRTRHAIEAVTYAFFAATLLTVRPATAQEIIRLPAEDRLLEAEFEDVYRVGTMTGDDWEQFGNVRRVAFDGAGPGGLVAFVETDELDVETVVVRRLVR